VGDGSRIVRLWCAFTTPSMAIAYVSSRYPTPKVRAFDFVCGAGLNNVILFVLCQVLVLRRPENSGPVDGESPPIFITALSL
jgi:hypothetical protein